MVADHRSLGVVDPADQADRGALLPRFVQSGERVGGEQPVVALNVAKAIATAALWR